MKQFVESIKRLYQNGMVDEKKIMSLFNDGKITQEEMAYILNNR